MATIQTVRCPNCGSLAERHYHAVLAQVQTQCDACDYLMVVSTLSGNVIEAHSPGTSFESIHKHMKDIKALSSAFPKMAGRNDSKLSILLAVAE
jgi:rubredoxin